MFTLIGYVSKYIRVNILSYQWYVSAASFGSMAKRSESPVQSPQSWPPARRRLFLGRWTVCRLSPSWGGRRCRPWLACVLRRWSWSPHHRTSASAASRRNSPRSVWGAGGEIGSYSGYRKRNSTNTNSVWAVRIFTPCLPRTHLNHQIDHQIKKTKANRKKSDFFQIFYSTCTNTSLELF